MVPPLQDVWSLHRFLKVIFEVVSGPPQPEFAYSFGKTLKPLWVPLFRVVPTKTVLPWPCVGDGRRVDVSMKIKGGREGCSVKRREEFKGNEGAVAGK